MGLQSDGMHSPGDIMRRLQQLETQVRGLQTVRRLEAASIGSGGLTIKGGAIVIQDAAGNETMRLSTDGLTLQGLLEVLGGLSLQGEGGLVVQDEAVVRSSDFDGSLDPLEAGTEGWALGGQGAAAFSSLALRDGIIGSNALAEQIVTVADGVQSSVNVPQGSGNEATILSRTLTTPEWASSVAIVATVAGSYTHASGSGSNAFTRIGIGGVFSAYFRTRVVLTPAHDAVAGAFPRTITDPPATIPVVVRAYDDDNVSNGPVGLSIIAVFQR